MPTQTRVSGSPIPTKPTFSSRNQMRNEDVEGARTGPIHGPPGAESVPGKRLGFVQCKIHILLLVFPASWEVCVTACCKCNSRKESHDVAHHLLGSSLICCMKHLLAKKEFGLRGLIEVNNLF